MCTGSKCALSRVPETYEYVPPGIITGIRCALEAGVLVSGVPGTYVQGITVRG
jgi:hypothetical protein